MSTNPKYKTREAWLNAAIGKFRPLIESKGYAWVPMRISVGWPTRNGLSKIKRTIGQCWPPQCSKDGVTEMFISPYLEEAGGDGVLSTVLHELIHAVVGTAAGHKGAFKQLALSLGFHGPMTRTPAGPELKPILDRLAAELGPYPHATLDRSRIRKQTTRMFKCFCKTCGFTVRMTKKWLDDVGPAHCPNHGAMTAEIPDKPKADDNGEIYTVVS